MTHFNSEDWWDEKGPFRLLHAWLPLRMRFILDNLNAVTNHGLNPSDPKFGQPLSGLHIVDVGCGGGLICEPLARLGAKVTGLDPAPRAIACAQNRHNASLNVDYICVDPMTWHSPESVDAVILFEVLEHVPDPLALIQKTVSWLKPGGKIMGSTLNRTRSSAILAIGLAEYILQWIPKGTHHWADFLTPQELHHFLILAGAEQPHIQGCTYHPISGWCYGPMPDINYFFAADYHPEKRTAHAI